MNMLIAVMGDTYERVAGQIHGMLQCQMAEIIAEAELFYAGPSRRVDPRLHSVWPGDSTAHTEHELAHGERINLTFRTIVRHLDGGDESRGLRCPLAG